MELIDYLNETGQTAIYPNVIPKQADAAFVGLMYCSMKLAEEAGEVAGKVAKALRDNGGVIDDERRTAIITELGDVAWYWIRLCCHMGIDPRGVLDLNVKKLRDRKLRGVLGGSGDNR